MSKFYGKVGYVSTSETSPGVYEPTITERSYYGDRVRRVSRWDPNGQINDDININENIEILADEFAYENFQYIKYVVDMGAKWKVTSIEPNRPRLILSLGGLYNGEQT